MIDIHCHLLSGVDDGAVDLAESIEMAEKAVSDGIQTIVVTPHHGNGVYTQSRADIAGRVAALQEVLEGLCIPLTLHPGMEEHFRPTLIEEAQAGTLCPLGTSGNYVLVEFPFLTIPDGAEDMFFHLQMAGYTVILAHPERNVVLQNQMERLYRLVHIGCLTQITEMSLTGELGERAMQCAHRMVQHRLAHILASDAHSADSRFPRLSEGVEIVKRLTKNPKLARQMVEERPAAILAGSPLHVPEPVPPKPKKRFLFF